MTKVWSRFIALLQAFLLHFAKITQFTKNAWKSYQIPEQLKSMYCRWMLDSAGVQFGAESESLLIDIVRYIIVIACNAVLCFNALTNILLI